MNLSEALCLCKTEALGAALRGGTCLGVRLRHFRSTHVGGGGRNDLGLRLAETANS
jgi:hypothetical protein